MFAPACLKGRPLQAIFSSLVFKALEGVWASALNKTFYMKLVAELGLEVAKASYQPDTRACLVRRYDRRADAQDILQRLHQIDFR
ncbi:HipA domain-containing protein [Vreelandella sulfidaeris]|uniref:HipA domain-containing protein n=1 Tax=Vreelandella sulfidaeris TaxID=115553 RepID=UPI0035ED332D